MGEQSCRVTIRLPKSLRDWLQREADECGETLSDGIRDALESHRRELSDGDGEGVFEEIHKETDG